MTEPEELKIVETADGSNTIFNPLVGENYHSTHGALQESRHVFIDAGLAYFLGREPEKKSVSIIEVGFGTGLNFLLSADYCSNKAIGLTYTGIEPFPLSPEMIRQTGYGQYTNANTWKHFIEKYKESINSRTSMAPNCELEITVGKLQDFHSEHTFDIVYFDAFASGKQPEMWTQEILGHTIKFLKTGGVFVTYAITGNLKRALKGLNCTIEKAKGAPGKREMLRAIRL
jgi:tRNA U34 5-methylaminomethyl-2-thiouridine-forming methyltransferase MnmC